MLEYLEKGDLNRRPEANAPYDKGDLGYFASLLPVSEESCSSSLLEWFRM